MDLRSKRITVAFDLRGMGIEYGPLNRIVIQKDEYPNVKYVDFATRDDLIKQYINSPVVDVTKIPEIDIVTRGEPISHFVEKGTLSYIIASHVMEHVPDMIGWLEENLSLLKPGGHIGIAFPDRRYCFDMTKNPSLFSDLIPAYMERRTKPSFAQICDHIFNTVRVTATDIWSGATTNENAKTIHTKEAAFKAAMNLFGKTDYIDSHCWKFSDEELLKALNDIKAIVGLPFDIISFSPTVRNSSEFYVTLQKSGVIA